MGFSRTLSAITQQANEMIEIQLRFKKNDISIEYDNDKRTFIGKLNFASFKDKKLKVQAKFFKNPVNDKCRYMLTKNSNQWRVRYPDDSSNDTFTHTKDIRIKSEKEKNIVLLLESPHRSEFNVIGKELKPISPATGKAGIYLNQYLKSHVLPILDSLGMKSKNNHDYKLCIVNPIQYQTSLFHIDGHSIDSDLRNLVWKKLYPHCQEDFKTRLTRYKPVIILNGCTSKLKNEVHSVLKEFHSAQQFSVHHPTNWQLYLGAFKAIDTE